MRNLAVFLALEQCFERRNRRLILQLRQSLYGGAAHFGRGVFKRRDQMRSGGRIARQSELACRRSPFGWDGGSAQVARRVIKIPVLRKSLERTVTPLRITP